MFVRNAWYVATDPTELAERSIIARRILDERIVIFRTESGGLAALEDACPHRKAPLSLGRIAGETIQCGYHGAAFGVDGRCTSIPGQSLIPRGAQVRSYPIQERHGFIWIWTGDPERAGDESSIPETFSVGAHPDYRGGHGLFESLKTNYRLLNDNLFDITHAEYVHPESFGGAEVRFYRNAHRGTEPIDRGLSFNIKDKSIHFRTYAASLGDEGAPLWRNMMAAARGLNGWTEPLDFKMEVNWLAPCYTSFHIYMRPAGQPDAPAVEFHNLHAAIPETASSTHYFYCSLQNYGDGEATARFLQGARFIHGQDVAILEGQQEVVGKDDVLDLDHVSFKGDKLQLEGRRILERMILEEQRA